MFDALNRYGIIQKLIRNKWVGSRWQIEIAKSSNEARLE